MNNYFDSFGRLHDKPCINGEPSSNNGWIYTAYLDKLGTSINGVDTADCFYDCLINGKFALRSPNKPLPYLSRDELLGASSLGLCKPHHLNGWNFYGYDLPKFSLIDLVKQLWNLKPYIVNDKFREFIKHPNEVVTRFPDGFILVSKHRNYFWQNQLKQIYRFAFSVPLQDRYFLLTCWDTFKWYKPSHLFYFTISKLDSLLPSESGIRWLKYGKSLSEMQKEFPNDHPLRM